MAKVLFMDGFDTYSNFASECIGDDWVNIITGFFAGYVMITGLNGEGKALRLGDDITAGTQDSWVMGVLKEDAPDEVWIGFYCKVWSTPTQPVMRIMTNTHDVIGQIMRYGSGRFGYAPSTSESEANAIALTTDPVPVDIPFHFLMRLRLHETEGEVDIWIGGAPQASETGLDTMGATDPFRRFSLWGLRSSHYIAIDDFYIADSNLGAAIVRGVFVDSDAGPNEWTPSTGTDHHSLLSESAHDSDGSYVESGTLGEKEYYGIPAFNVSGFPIAVKTKAVAKVPEGFRSMRMNVRSGVTEGLGPANILSPSYAPRTRIIHNDPATGDPWDTVADVEAAEFGMETRS